MVNFSYKLHELKLVNLTYSELHKETLSNLLYFQHSYDKGTFFFISSSLSHKNNEKWLRECSVRLLPYSAGATSNCTIQWVLNFVIVLLISIKNNHSVCVCKLAITWNISRNNLKIIYHFLHHMMYKTFV